MRKVIAILVALGAIGAMVGLVIWAWAFLEEGTAASKDLVGTASVATVAPQPRIPLIPPPAATTQNVTQNDRRKYLLDLWSHSRSSQIKFNPLLRTLAGTIVPVPQLPDDDAIGASMVTIHGTGSVHDMLEQIAEQVQTRIGAEHPNIFHGDQPIHLELTRAPMLEALNELCSQAGLKIVRSEPVDSTASSGALPRLILGESISNRGLGPWSISGPFSYEITQIQHSVALSPNSYNNDYLTVFIAAHNEAKLHVFCGPGVFSLEEAVDENGNSLLTAPGSWRPADMPNQTAIHLTYPATNPGRHIARLRATDHCVIAKTVQHVEIPVPQAGSPQTQTIGGMVLSAEANTDENGSNTYNYKISLRRGERSEFDWAGLSKAAYGMTTKLQTADGNQLDPMGFPESQAVVDTVTLNRQWWKSSGNRAESPPIKIVLDVPINVRAVDIPVNFDNLPLP